MNWLEWAKNNLGKGVIGAIGFVTTVIGFVNLIRGDYYLGFTILGTLFLAGSLLAFIYISFSTTPSPIVPSRRIYRFEKYRSWSLLGIGLVIALVVTILVLKPSRAFIGAAFIGTPTPTWTPTPTPTITLTPTLSPTSTVTPTPEAPEVTMLVTVEEGLDCYFYWDRYWVQESILDVAINNNSDRDILLTSVLLRPEDISVELLSGELKITEVYSVTVDNWIDWYESIPLGQRDSWVEPEPIYVEYIPANKYTIKRQSQERFRIILGISSAKEGMGDYLVTGRIFLEVETDSRQKLISGPLEITVCMPD